MTAIEKERARSRESGVLWGCVIFVSRTSADDAAASPSVCVFVRVRAIKTCLPRHACAKDIILACRVINDTDPTSICLDIVGHNGHFLLRFVRHWNVQCVSNANHPAEHERPHPKNTRKTRSQMGTIHDTNTRERMRTNESSRMPARR